MKIEKFDFDKFKDVVHSNIKTKKLLFHCSPVAGLKELNPRPSYAYKKGTKPCVFASYHLSSILFYGSKKHKGDLDGNYGVYNEQGDAFFYEAYYNSLEKVYKGERCYIYLVDQENSNFEENQTSYSAEVVDGSGKTVKLLACYEVDDIYDLILKFRKFGFINLFYYKDYTEKEYKRILEHQKFLIKFYSKDKNSPNYKFCEEHYPKAIEEFNQQFHSN